MEEFKDNAETEFNTWFETVKSILSTDTVTNLQHEIDNLESTVNANYNYLTSLATSYENVHTWQDSSGAIYDQYMDAEPGTTQIALQVTVFESDGSITQRLYTLDKKSNYVIAKKVIITFPDGKIAYSEVQSVEGDTYTPVVS
jgi:hypothetical protein